MTHTFTRDNMNQIQMEADNKIWAEWLQHTALEAVGETDTEKRAAIKAKLDFMTDERMMGCSFEKALMRFASLPADHANRQWLELHVIDVEEAKAKWPTADFDKEECGMKLGYIRTPYEMFKVKRGAA